MGKTGNRIMSIICSRRKNLKFLEKSIFYLNNYGIASCN
jgi:hypothetical protein